MTSDKDYWIRVAGRRLGILDTVEWELNQLVSLFENAHWSLVEIRLRGLRDMVSKRRKEEESKMISIPVFDYTGGDWRE